MRELIGRTRRFELQLRQ